MAEVRIDDIPSNSQKSREQALQTAQEDKKPDIPVFEGETKQAKRKTNGFLRWCKKMFLSDRTPKEIAMEVVEQRIVPGLQDNFRNSAMAMLDGFIYKGGIAPSGGTNNSVNYNKIYSGQQQTRPAYAAPQQDQKRDEINKGFGNPCFKSRVSRRTPDGKIERGAEDFLAMMQSYDYPTLSVHTLYMMQNKHIDYTWDAYGWTHEEILALNTGCIKHINDPEYPWMIQLPEAHVIA